jgi:hypothetical protein
VHPVQASLPHGQAAIALTASVTAIVPTIAVKTVPRIARLLHTFWV